MNLFNSGVVALLAGVAVYFGIQAMRAKAQKKAQARADRLARKLRDRRDNMGGRIYNALDKAARENPAGACVVRRFEENGRLCVSIDQRKENGRYSCVLRVELELDAIVGFQITARAYSWEYYWGPEEYIVREVIPRLVKLMRTFGVK